MWLQFPVYISMWSNNVENYAWTLSEHRALPAYRGPLQSAHMRGSRKPWDASWPTGTMMPESKCAHSHAKNFPQRASGRGRTVQEKEAISGVTGGFGWLIIECVVKKTNVPLVFIPMNGVSWIRESQMQHFVESMHSEQLRKGRILWKRRTNQNEVPISDTDKPEKYYEQTRGSMNGGGQGWRGKMSETVRESPLVLGEEGWEVSIQTLGDILCNLLD